MPELRTVLLRAALPLVSFLALAASGACTAQSTEDVPVGSAGEAISEPRVADCPAKKPKTCAPKCGAGQTCVDGKCQESCSGTVCGSACVDLTSDPDNCGACGVACLAGDTCQEGACHASCSGVLCSGTCVDLTSDPDNCGGCGEMCETGEICQEGVCLCSGSDTFCYGGCVDLASDPNNCGACGDACPAGETCQAGACG